MSLSLTSLQNIPLIRHGDNLADIVVNALDATNITLQDDDILVLAQKIVSKAEGRAVNLATITPSHRAIGRDCCSGCAIFCAPRNTRRRERCP